MNQENFSTDQPQKTSSEVPKLSSGLNVLTIFSFIGCAIGLIFGIWNFIGADKAYKDIDKTIEKINAPETPGWVKSMFGDPELFRQMMTKAYENKIPLLILSLLAVALCFYGVIQMRKLKKQGFVIYTVGELLPFASQALFIGFFSFTGIGFYFFLTIALLFILLYTLQRKNLIY